MSNTYRKASVKCMQESKCRKKAGKQVLRAGKKARVEIRQESTLKAGWKTRVESMQGSKCRVESIQ